MAIPERLRDPVALSETAAFTILGIGAALLGSMPWVPAVLTGLVIGAVVLTISTWRKRRSIGNDESRPQPDVAALVHEWARKLADDDSAREDADESVTLAGDIVDLTLECRLGITKRKHEDPARKTAEESLRTVGNYVIERTETAPAGPYDWRVLRKNLGTAKGHLHSILKDLRRAPLAD
jgi:hypothetical protein